MSVVMEWGSSFMFDGFSVFSEGLVSFNDYLIVLSMIVLWFVFVLMTNELLVGALSIWEVESVFIEFIWTLLPMMMLGFMAYPSMALLYMCDEGGSVDLVVKVLGHQWYWEYEVYLSSLVNFDSYMGSEWSSGLYRLLDVDNRLVLPMFSAVQLLITSMDVIHSWALPSMGVKVDAIPGVLNQVVVGFLMPGVMYGQCSELCGVNHSFMPIVVEVVHIKDFVAWYLSF